MGGEDGVVHTYIAIFFLLYNSNLLFSGLFSYPAQKHLTYDHFIRILIFSFFLFFVKSNYTFL